MGLIKTILTYIKFRIPEQRRALENNVIEADLEDDNTNDVMYYKKLYQAAREGNWKAASEFFRKDPASVTAKITRDNETALHVAVGAGHRNDLLRNLINVMEKDALGLTEGNGETALSIAAIVGNVDAVKMLVEKNEYLPYIWSGEASPLHRAAQYGHREIVAFLLEKTKPNIGLSPYADVRGVLLVELLIISRLYDLALRVIEDHPIILEAMPRHKKHSPLMALANQPSSFLSGTSFNLWQRFIYHCIRSTKLETNTIVENQNLSEDGQNQNQSGDVENQNQREDGQNQNQSGDVENQTQSKDGQNQNQSGDVENQNQSEDQLHRKLSRCSKIGSGCRNACARLLQTISEALCIKQVQDIKKMHKNVQDVVEKICAGISHLGHEEAQQLFKDPFLLAATWGIKEIVNEIIRDFPSAIWFNQDGYSLFHLAVLNRRREIFSLIHDNKSDVNQIIRKHIDRNQNNLLHLAARLAPSHRLSLISGVVLQMQDELQWFKEVESFVEVHYRESKNNDGKTPEMVFIEEHKDLVKEAGDWMNKTASACSTAATLIATVVFAASITVPGGNNSETGLPVLLKRRTFTIFAISDATALFSSTASLLMFLAILTSRYSHKDFLKALPRKLIIGLLTLFLAMASLMVAFSTTLYLVIGDGRKHIFLAVEVLGGVVVLLFVLMFSSLVGKMIASTYATTIRYICRPLVWLIEFLW